MARPALEDLVSRRRFPWLGVVVLAGLLGPLHRAEAGVDLSGPIVGHVTSTTATIWAYAGAREKISVKYRREADPKTSVREVAMPPYTTGPGTCRVTLTGLDPDTRYVFAPVVRGGFPPAWKGWFKTAPVEGRPA